MKLNSALIALPYLFDAERMAHEVQQFATVPWMSHPDKTDGNSALPLISRDGGENDDFRGRMKPTPYLERCPYLQQVIASFDEVFGRSRLMRLEAGCEVKPHVDFNYHWHSHVRIHIPVITNPQVTFVCGDSQIHMQAGECWIFDSWRRHTVVNAGLEARIHLVIDTAGSSRFWDTVERADQAMRAAAPLPARFFAHEIERSVQIVTERYNVQPVMSPGEVDGLTQDLIAEFETVPENDNTHVAISRKIMLGFCKDWRALWYQYGLHQTGWPHYAKLVATTSRALPEFQPPLALRNKMCTVKNAFGARVLAVTLSRDIYNEFMSVETASDRPASGDAKPANSTTEQTIRAAPQPDTVQASAAAIDEVARNARCPCGSGRRYKHCHGAVRPTA